MEVMECVRYRVLGGALGFGVCGSLTPCKSGVVGDARFTSWKPSRGSLAIVSES